jgi:hypothetical protein
MPGRQINDCQLRSYMRSRLNHTPAVAAAKAGFSTATAYRIEAKPRLPPLKKRLRGGRHPDTLPQVWDSVIVPILKMLPAKRANAVFEEICRHHPVSAAMAPSNGVFGSNTKMSSLGNIMALRGRRTIARTPDMVASARESVNGLPSALAPIRTNTAGPLPVTAYI